jgi:DNA-binding transcriptional ArsR family regulator
VQQGDFPDLSIQNNFHNVGISVLCEWDTATFLYRHGACLSTVEQIARLLGYPKTTIAVALERLESIGLVRRSRSAQGVRMYQFVEPSDPPVHNSFQELMSLSETRTGRLLLVRNLRRIASDKNTRRRDGLHLA